MKVLLTAINAKYIHSNLAIYSLREYAAAYRESISLAEYSINHSREEILHGLYRKKPDVIAFSCYIWNIEIIEQLILELVKIMPGAEIWLGGPEVSWRAKEMMQEYPCIKLIMSGEGEAAFLSLMELYMDKKGSLSKIPGITYRTDNKVIQNKPASLPALSELPFAYTEFTASGKDMITQLENRIIYYQSSRGCPFSCAYCLSSIEKSLRFRDMELVKRELDFFLAHRVKQVKFVDRTFNADYRHARQIWEYISEHDNGVTNFHFEIAADLIKEEDIRVMAAMRPGLIQLEIGIQSVNPQTLSAIRRTADWKRIREVIAEIRALGNIHQHLDLIAGLPYEDIKSFKNSFNEVYRMRPDQLQLGFLKILSGTEIEERAGEYGIVYQNNPPYEVLYTRWLSYEDLLELKGVEEMTEVYYNSLQFVHTLGCLVPFFQTPYDFYKRLADFYRQHEGEKTGIQYSRMSRFEMLLEFAGGFLKPEEIEVMQTAMIYDFYLRENAKNAPSFAAKGEVDKAFIKEFYYREAKERVYLPDYQDYDGRQLARMTHLERFVMHPVTKEMGEVYILFDYKNRNPLNYDARTITVQTNAVK